MLDKTKINFSQKKLSGKQHTWNSKKWYEEDDGIVLFQHAQEVWIDRVISTPPENRTDIIKPIADLVMIEDKTVQGRRSFFANDGEGNRITGFIPPSYGINYTVKLFVNGVKIPTTHQSNWIFDYSNGVISFENTPPSGVVTIQAYEYVGRSLQQYLDAEFNSIACGVMGIGSPELEYTIQHNMSSFDVDVIVYVFDDVSGEMYWKKDVVPLILLDENRVKLQLTEKHPIRFIIKSYEMPNWL